MSLNGKSQEQIAAKQLTDELLKRLADKRAGEVASLAHVQSTLTNAAVQAVIEILVHKNVISAADFSAALRHHYNRQHDMLVHRDDQIVVPQQAPIARPE